MLHQREVVVKTLKTSELGPVDVNGLSQYYPAWNSTIKLELFHESLPKLSIVNKSKFTMTILFIVLYKDYNGMCVQKHNNSVSSFVVIINIFPFISHTLIKA